jgi:hypothetical protein
VAQRCPADQRSDRGQAQVADPDALESRHIMSGF